MREYRFSLPWVFWVFVVGGVLLDIRAWLACPGFYANPTWILWVGVWIVYLSYPEIGETITYEKLLSWFTLVLAISIVGVVFFNAFQIASAFVGGGLIGVALFLWDERSVWLG